jgi:hypothetical protein
LAVREKLFILPASSIFVKFDFRIIHLF